jgi:hypothetical protein
MLVDLIGTILVCLYVQYFKVPESRVMSMNVDGHHYTTRVSSGRLRKRLMDCVRDDMKIKGVSMEMTSDRRWKKKTCFAVST